MCGLESLAEALRPVPAAPPGAVFSPEQVLAAVASLGPAQVLNQATRAVHAAGFWRAGAGLAALREDVGRHNALDKLYGALALNGIAASDGVVVLTSRISIELVQKAARMGAAVVAAVSAPTALAVRAAEAAGITLVGVARGDGFEVFCGRERLSGSVTT
jgi:FdhD protein